MTGIIRIIDIEKGKVEFISEDFKDRFETTIREGIHPGLEIGVPFYSQYRIIKLLRFENNVIPQKIIVGYEKVYEA